ncbi:MAG: HAMP domain-containing sensor histidine kinase [Rhodospirillales bacterium]
MDTQRRKERWRWLTGLSGRLLALTAAFVMLAEVLVFVPSISRFRLDYLEERIAKAHLAILALEATPDNMIDERLEQELLYHAGAYAIVLKSPDRRMLMLSATLPDAIDVTYDLRSETMVDWVGDALATLFERGNRVIRVIGPSPRAPDSMIEIVLDQRPMRMEMLSYSRRILELSLIISFITAVLVFVSLQWLLVRPMRRITDSIIRFRQAPEDAGTEIPDAGRSDEIGLAQRELSVMQRDLSQALHQKTRLAALGAAMTKINHDLNNTLATAVLASDRLAAIEDPEVQRLTPRLLAAIDRAVALCARTLDFARSDKPTLRESDFPLDSLLNEVCGALKVRDDSTGPRLRITTNGCDALIHGDREQLFRVFSNLVLNAERAGAGHIRITARRDNRRLLIDVIDDGSGIPAHVQPRLFQPFAVSGESGGSGLGLVIAREIVAAHGGSLSLAATGPDGTSFRIDLPARRVRNLAA